MSELLNSNKNIKISNIFYYVAIIGLFIFGVYCRTKIYLTNSPFWVDEVMLGHSFIDRDLFGMFSPLDANQKAPPIFLCITYFIIKIFGFDELNFRIIPYVSGILSLVGFFFLVTDYINSKLGRILGYFLFVVSVPLIYYSVEFKPYSSDVLVCILLFLAYKHISLKNAGVSKIIFYSAVSIFLVLLSFPMFFVIPSMVLAKFIEEKNISKRAILILICVLLAGLYLYLYDVHTFDFMQKFWFFSGTKKNTFKYMIGGTLGYFMNNFKNNFSYYLVALNFAGLIVLLKDKFDKAILFICLISLPLFTSLLLIYPFRERLVLYLLPIFIILISKIIDFPILFNVKIKWELIIKIVLCILVLFILNVKIPLINLSEIDIIKYAKLNERDRSLNARLLTKKFSLMVLDNYNDNDRILASDEFIYYINFYNKRYKYNKNLKFHSYGYDFKKEINTYKVAEKFVNEFGDKCKLWIIGRDYENYFRCCQFWDIETAYLKKNLKYNFNLSDKWELYLLDTKKE